MYMALFDAGISIREKLVAAGADFWGHASMSNSPSDDDESAVSNGLSFWFFPDDQGDEAIKETFQLRLLSAFSLLTASEWVDVIWEAIDILEWCLKIIHEIDVEVARAAHRARRSRRRAYRMFSSFMSSLPCAPSLWPQPKASTPRRARINIRPLLAGVVGCLGGLCMWLLKR
jgi:hypothetical protein